MGGRCSCKRVPVLGPLLSSNTTKVPPRMVCFGDEDWAAAPHLGDARSSFVGIIPQLLRFRGAHADQVPVAPIMEVVKGATAEWVSQRVEEVARAEAGGGPAGSLSDDTLRLKGIGDVKIIVFAFGSGDVRLQTPVDSFAASARAACLSAAAVAGDTPCRLIVTSVPDESAAPPALGESSEAAWREQATTLVDAYNAALRGIVERNGGVFVDVTRVTRMERQLYADGSGALPSENQAVVWAELCLPACARALGLPTLAKSRLPAMSKRAQPPQAAGGAGGIADESLSSDRADSELPIELDAETSTEFFDGPDGLRSAVERLKAIAAATGDKQLAQSEVVLSASCTSCGRVVECMRTGPTEDLSCIACWRKFLADSALEADSEPSAHASAVASSRGSDVRDGQPVCQSCQGDVQEDGLQTEEGMVFCAACVDRLLEGPFEGNCEQCGATDVPGDPSDDGTFYCEACWETYEGEQEPRDVSEGASSGDSDSSPRDTIGADKETTAEHRS